MNDEIKKAAADAAYKKLCETLDKGFAYDRNDERRNCSLTASTNDIDVHLSCTVYERQQVLRLLSKMPFVFPQNKIVDGCLAVAYASNLLIDGGFIVDIATGEVYFKHVMSFRDCPLNDECILYMITMSYSVVDRFNDRFLAIAEGKLDVNDFIS